ncbi:MAG: hypothetical protein JWM85_1390 [Acidimicrobiaceae bacterium]|nr:hypothetical protein [Acidimicrobiaceae bacterium]
MSATRRATDERRHRPLARAKRPEPLEANPLSPTATVLSLQRSVGNRAVVEAISRLRDDEPNDRVAPAQDQEKERQADAIADRATSRLGPRGLESSQTGKSSGGVPPALAALLAPELGRTDRVSFRTGGREAAEASSMGAAAFADDGRVGFAPGELDLSSKAGVHLAAHETAHGVLHRSSSSGSTRLVHAKLRGTREAAESQGGGATTKGLRKALSAKTNWDKILDGLGAYEELESTLLSSGNPSSKVLAGARPKMLKVLARVEAACLDWQGANGAGDAEKLSESWHKKFRETGDQQQSDDRSKAQRRQVVAMLLPRIRNEMNDIGSGQWDKALGLSDTQLVSKGREDSGQMNKVTEMNYKTESGEFSGFFKAEKGFDKSMAGQDIDVGIRQADPNWGSRALAMYKLDQLLGAGVTARVEYAVHDGQFGTVMETAKGTRANEVNYTRTDETQSKTPGSVSLEDGTLQRCLNKLQILDAISGQLDRHMGNYFVQTGENGKVTGVTGIDLDMSFGQDMKTHDDRSSGAAQNYKGLPDAIDEEFGKRILQISENDVRGAITGLLSGPEVEATISRFRSVRAKVEAAEKNGTLTKDWNKDTAKQQMPEKSNDFKFSFLRKKYGADLASASNDNLVKRIITETREHIARVFTDIPPLTLEMYQRLLGGPASEISEEISEAVHKGEVKETQVDSIVHKAVEALARDTKFRNMVEIEVQEHGDARASALDPDSRAAARDALGPILAAYRIPVRSS